MYTNEWSHGHFIAYHDTTLTNLKDVWFIINLEIPGYQVPCCLMEMTIHFHRCNF